MKTFLAIALSGALLGSTGCGTLVTMGDANSGPYSGVGEDAKIITAGPPKPDPEFDLDLRPFAVMDLPFSLIADTIVLPLTVTFAIQKHMEEGSVSAPPAQAPPQPTAPTSAH